AVYRVLVDGEIQSSRFARIGSARTMLGAARRSAMRSPRCCTTRRGGEAGGETIYISAEWASTFVPQRHKVLSEFAEFSAARISPRRRYPVASKTGVGSRARRARCGRPPQALDARLIWRLRLVKMARGRQGRAASSVGEWCRAARR